jgi:hypothetical protein
MPPSSTISAFLPTAAAISGKHLDRGAAVVELAPAVVRDIDGADAVRDGECGVLGCRDAF